jgi:Flp pilus assembly pilin Flp
MGFRLSEMWRQEDGVLSFEWALLITLVVIGIVGGLAAARDAITDELGDAAEAMMSLDGSYTISYPLQVAVNINDGNGFVTGLASDSGFLDTRSYGDCGRTQFAPGPQPREGGGGS